MPTTISFTPVVGNYVAPANLETVASAYNTLEQGHQKAIVAESAVEQELAKLDLNEAEDAWRQQQINKIKTALTDNTRYGNAYTSLDDVIRTSGNVMSQPGMIGRLRAQQDYKTYLDQLEKRTDLSEDYKNVFRQVNTYNYKDVLDANGNVIGGTKWQPTWKEVSEVPMNEILTNALKWAAKEAGGGSQTRWLDINGNPTSDPSQSVTGEYFDRTTNQWTALTKDKLAAAVRASIETTPGAKASLEQDYRIAKWKYDQNNGVNPDITDKAGFLLSPEEYLNKRIDPFYKAATYFNQSTSTEYGNALSAQLAYKAKQAGYGDGISPTQTADALSILTNPITIDNLAPIQEQGNLNMANQAIVGLLLKNNPNANINLDGMTDDQLTAAINNISNPEDRANALIQMRIRSDANEYLNYIKGDMGETDRLKFDAYVAINSGTKLEQGTNDYYDEYVAKINRPWNDAKYLRNYLEDAESVEKFYDYFGGRDKARSMGITDGVKDGKRYIQIDDNNKNYTGIFAKVISQTLNDRNPFLQIWSTAKSVTNNFTRGNRGNAVVRVGNDGNEEPINTFTSEINTSVYRMGKRLLENPITRQPISPDYLSTEGNDVFYDLTTFYDNLNRDYDNSIRNTSKITIGQQAIRAATPDVAESLFRLKQDPSAENQRVYKLNEDEAMDALQGLDIVQAGAYTLDENNKYVPITTKERKEIQGAMRSSKASISNPNAVQDPNTGLWGPSFNVTYKDKDGNDITTSVFVPGGINSAITQKWNRDTGFRAKNTINLYFAQERDVPLTRGAAFSGIEGLYIRHRNGATSLIDKTGNRNMGSISTADAITFKDVTNQWEDTYNAVKAGLVTPNAITVTNLATQVAAQIATMTGSADSNSIAYYYSKLMDNLVK